jgi:hypothetical protein
VGTGLISLASKPVSVEEQPVARTRVVPRATASKAARLIWLAMVWEPELLMELALVEGVFLTMYLFIGIRWFHS